MTTELTKQHNRKTFNCGTPVLNEYLNNSARQHIDRGISRTYVLTDENSTTDIIGFHTLTLSEVYAPKSSKLYNKYPHKLPVLKIARLAVDIQYQGRGVGGFLLSDVMKKAIQANEVAPIMGVVVDAKDQKAKEFYLPYGFIEAGGKDDEFYLFLPMKVIKEAMQS
jgi:N-acetylglutamate synthase-like GNAT family acetyltransferase